MSFATGKVSHSPTEMAEHFSNLGGGGGFSGFSDFNWGRG